MRELTVISGKGGTGKTSITAALAVLAKPCVLADCDVDASNLPLLLSPRVEESASFTGGMAAEIHDEACCACGVCALACRFDAIAARTDTEGRTSYTVVPYACEGCGVCRQVCPTHAVELRQESCGQWFRSTTALGPLVHARLDPGGENSGKLVSLVREQARQIANNTACPLVIIDGSPGIGCPVIASITGASHALVVTEPTVSGRHDLERILELTNHFGVPASLCVNKWDLNPNLAKQLEQIAVEKGAEPAGRVRYDKAFTAAQIEGRPITETSSDGPVEDIRALWHCLRQRLDDAVAPVEAQSLQP